MDIDNFGRNISKLNLIHRRVLIIILAIAVLYSILIFRMFELNIVKYLEASSIESKQYASKSYKLMRRQIVDRNEQILAANLRTASLYANCKQIKDPEYAAQAICEILTNINHDELLEKLKSDSSFKWIKRHLTPKEQQQINDLGIYGLIMVDDQKRIYPNTAALSHVVGFVDVDGNGMSGIERQYDQLLKTKDEDATPLKLTIDLNVQSIARDILLKHVDRNSAIGGSVIVMEPYSGEIIAMVSVPDFDPNFIEDNNAEKMFNRNTMGLYEPGSTAKVLTVAMALDLGVVNENSIYNVSEPLKYGRFTIHDYKGKGGDLSVREIMMYSSNLGAAQIITKGVGSTKQKEYLDKFGFFDAVKLDFPEKASPMFPKRNWSEVSAATISFGHGIAVSPLHAVLGFVSVINGGYMIKPKLVKDSLNEQPQRVISKATSIRMRKVLRTVVAEGRTGKAEVPGYFVAGKTGTSEKVKGKGYAKDANIASVCVTFPYYDPKYVVYAMLDEAKGNEYNHGFTTGGMIAAPLASELIENIAPLLKVAPSSEHKVGDVFSDIGNKSYN